MARVSREEWAKRVQRWTDSGLSGAQFAAEIGVKEATLRHWKWQLGKIASSCRPTPRRRQPARFVELVAAAPPAAASPAEPLEVILANGLCLRVPPRFDTTALRELVSALRSL